MIPLQAKAEDGETMAPVETEDMAAAVAMAEEAVATEEAAVAADTAEVAEAETEAAAAEVDTAEAVGADMEAAVEATEAARAVDVEAAATAEAMAAAATVVETAGEAPTETETTQELAGEQEAHEAAWMAAEEVAWVCHQATSHSSPGTKEARAEDAEAETSARLPLPTAPLPTATRANLLTSTARTPAEAATCPEEAPLGTSLAAGPAVVRAAVATPRCTLAT